MVCQEEFDVFPDRRVRETRLMSLFRTFNTFSSSSSLGLLGIRPMLVTQKLPCAVTMVVDS